jgi:hypothetical protein
MVTKNSQLLHHNSKPKLQIPTPITTTKHNHPRIDFPTK